MTPQRNLGDALGAALDTGPSRRSLAAQREQVLAALEKPRWAGKPSLVLTTCAVVGVAAALYLTLARFNPTKEALRGAWQGRSLPESSRVVAPAERGETLSFSDGSRVELGARAEIALSKLAPEQARLELARGHLDATIRKGTGRAWTVAAGPYSVHVVGTAFTVDWDAGTRLFAVNVREGKVLVTGHDLREGGVLLGPGERLERQDSPAVGATAAAAPHEPQLGVPQPQSPAPEPSSARAEAAVGSSSEPDFRAAAARGNYAAAIVAARRTGFERLEAELSAKDLLMLANTARYAGSASEARGALLKLRERFPGSPSSAHAALLLASQAEDRDKNRAEAERWLRTFLEESPQGELAAGARARLLALLLGRGARAEAEQVARDYLRLHPGGPHAAQAQAVLQASH
ncbi:MAG TPA: FecR domain-containing protein [Polyangiaceae bacterium]|nr:FecR domain-containing protein [Polyangiaceae bacterium]